MLQTTFFWKGYIIYKTMKQHNYLLNFFCSKLSYWRCRKLKHHKSFAITGFSALIYTVDNLQKRILTYNGPSYTVYIQLQMTCTKFKVFKIYCTCIIFLCFFFRTLYFRSILWRIFLFSLVWQSLCTKTLQIFSFSDLRKSLDHTFLEWTIVLIRKIQTIQTIFYRYY